MRRNELKFIKFFGPAWLVMMADMDASSIIGAAQTGALFKYGFIWIMLLLVIPLYVVQEVSGRIGIATGKGLGEVIRENYSKKLAILMALPMALTDAVTYAIEYLGIGIGLEVIGIPLILSIPLIYVVHIMIVTKRKYIQAERFLLLISAFLIISLFATLFLRGIKPYSPFYFSPSPQFLFLMAATVGAVVMPFMLFFQASATAIKLKEIGHCKCKDTAIKHMRKETLLGAVFTEILMVVVEMAFAGINVDPSTFASPQELSSVLTPLAGSLSPVIFGLGLISAGFLALVVISLGSAWGVAEALNVKNVNIIYIAESVPAVVLTLLVPSVNLVCIVLDLLVFFVYALIGPIIILGIISRNKKIMGEYASRGLSYFAYWISSIILLIIAIIASLSSI
jgi:Mn2+ and Fe2+ transporters of the NRAMP family